MSYGAGDSGGVVSASSITTVATSGSHVLKINGYTAAKLVMSEGSRATSCEFEAAGHTWCIFYYPNGVNKAAADHISLSLSLARNDDNGVVVNARFRFSLVVPDDEYHHGGGGGAWKKKTNTRPTPAVVQSLAAVFQRSTYGYGHCIPCFVKREVLERSEYLVDDCFTVRCDIVGGAGSQSRLTLEPQHDLLIRLGLIVARIIASESNSSMHASRDVIRIMQPPLLANTYHRYQ